MEEQFRLIHLHTVDKEKISGEQPFKVNHVFNGHLYFGNQPRQRGFRLNPPVR
jgi:hypothetical protein